MDYVIHNEFDICSFQAWGGAKRVIEQAQKVGALYELQDLVEMVFDGYDEVTDTMINDFIWFDADDELHLWDEE